MTSERPSTDKTVDKPPKKRKWPLAVRIITAAGAAFLVLYFSAKAFLSTPYAAGLLSDYLSDSLGQRIVIEGVALSWGTISAQGVTIPNPAGFPAGALLTARSLSLAPNLPEILSGRRSLTLLRIEGMKVNLDKNAAGEWNFRSLIRRLTRKKERPGAEVFVRRLVLRDVSLRIKDFAVQRLALTVNDFSTKGLVNSKLVFTGADDQGNMFRVAAEGRLGKDPDVRVSLEAPNFSLGTLAEVMKGKGPLDLEKGTVQLSFVMRYRSGEAVASGHAAFDHLGVVVKERKAPLRGILDFAARYSMARDEASLERASLVLNDRITLGASGVVRRAKGEKEFAARLSCNEIALKEIAGLLPKETVKDLSVSGVLTCGDIRVAGTGTRGITSGGGNFSLRNGKAVKGGRTLFQGLSSDVVLSRTAGGWKMGGTLSMKERPGAVPVENLNARFAARFSEVFRPLFLEVPAFNAALKGVPVRGELTYTPKTPAPYRLGLYTKDAPLSAFNELLAGRDAVFSSGTADISLDGAGQGPESFTGELTAHLSGLKCKVAGKDCALQDGRIISRFSRSAGRVTADGKANLGGGAYAGKDFSGSFAYSLADGKFSLTDGKAAFQRVAVRFTGINGSLPKREPGPDGARYPLALALTGLEVAEGETRVRDVSGSVSAVYTPGPGGRRLTGSAHLSFPSVFFKNQSVGSLKANVTMSGEGAVANVNGTALDGILSSVAELDPFSPAKRVSFRGELRNADALKLSGLLPQSVKFRFPSGRITTSLEGNWSGAAGVRCGIEGDGNGMTLVTSEGKTLITGAAFTVRADVAGKDISVREATVRHGKDVTVKIAGSIADSGSPSRSGKFVIDLGVTPVKSLLDTFSGLLPKPLREADAAGGLGMSATLGINGGRIGLEGELTLNDVTTENSAQKLSLTGISGGVPFSLVLAGVEVERPSDDLSFSKENYPALLKTLRQRPKGGRLLKIGKVRFGALETDNIVLRLKAENGRIDITSLESALYNGSVVGKGYFLYDRGPYYGADLLINDMSLRQFCNSYPALKGYISGLLDGVISLYGEKGGLPAMIGFVDLWAHSGKGEKMLVSKEFLQRLAGKKLKGFFFREDRAYDRGEISAYLLDGYVTFERLDISHTNFLGMKDLSVSVAPVQNRIGLEHLFEAIRKAAARGRPAAGTPPVEAPVEPDIKWLE